MNLANKGKMTFVSLFLAILIASMIPIMTPTNVKALEPATLQILPTQNTFSPSTTLPGTRFTVNATLLNVVELNAWQVQIVWIPGVLNCTSMVTPAGSIFDFDIPVAAIIDNVFGTATMGASQLVSPPVNGSDVLCTAEFEILKLGITYINYSSPLGENTFLLDPLLHDIPAAVEGASFEYMSTLKIIPAENMYFTNTTLPGNGTRFTVNATLQDVIGLNAWQVQIMWDPSVLNCTSMVTPAGSIFDFDIPVAAIIDNVVGTATMGASQLVSPPVNGSDVLCTAEFEILKLGVSYVKYSSPLGENTFLLDLLQHDIPASVEDASFSFEFTPLVAHHVAAFGGGVFWTYSNTTILADSMTGVAGVGNEWSITFPTYGDTGSFGYVNITIPKALLRGPWVQVLVNNTDVTGTVNITEDASNTYVYVTYQFASIITVKVIGTIPESLPMLMLALLMGSLIAVVFVKRYPRRKLFP